MKARPSTMPMIGATTMKMRVLYQPSGMIRSEPFVHELRRFVLKNPVSGDHEGETKHHAHDRSDHDEDESFVPAFRDDHREHGRGTGMDGGMHHGGTSIAADQGVGGRGGKTPPPGKKIPDNGAEQGSHYDVLIYVFEADHAFADGLRDSCAQEEGGEKVEGCGPKDGQFRREHASGNHGRDAVGRVVKSGEEIEGQLKH